MLVLHNPPRLFERRQRHADNVTLFGAHLCSGGIGSGLRKGNQVLLRQGGTIFVGRLGSFRREGMAFPSATRSEVNA
jgi:hypothetical protein